jgi:hypothetical protein
MVGLKYLKYQLYLSLKGGRVMEAAVQNEVELIKKKAEKKFQGLC